MKRLYYTWDDNGESLHTAFFEEDSKPINSQLIQEPYLINPILENGVVVEGASEQEIEEVEKQNMLLTETQKYIQRAKDGVNAYAEISAEFRLAKLNGIISEETHSIVEKVLIPVRNEVLAGQWISAKNELELIGEITIGIDLYNRLHSQITNYISLNY